MSGGPGAPDAPITLRATGRDRRRLVLSRWVEATWLLAAAAAVGVLGLVIYSVLTRGISALTVDFFIKGPAVFGASGGGMAPAFIGSILVIAIATMMALPTGVLTAIYVVEFAPDRIGRQIRLWLDVLNGFPSIVIGVFVYALIVNAKVLGVGGKQSAWAAGFAIAIIMLPFVARATMEVLALVPNNLREASYALGVSKWRTVLSVVLPTSLGGILTGTTLAIARGAGESAPLLLVCQGIAGNLVNWHPTQSLATVPLAIFQNSESPDENLHAQAWAAAFVLIVFVLVTSLTARFLLERSRRKLGRVS